MNRGSQFVSKPNAVVTGTNAVAAPSRAREWLRWRAPFLRSRPARGADRRQAGAGARACGPHGVAVDVALRVLVAHVRYLGQPSLVERAHSVGGESDRGGEGGGTADRRRDIHA